MGLRDRTAIDAFRDDDLPGVARVWRELRPDAMHSERGLRHLIDSFPASASRTAGRPSTGSIGS